VKILAIRGKNIASLAGEFSIDFEAPPLANSGLFAIVGPTGSGKSSLLDVMCLALFDHTPRLSKKGGALVGLEGESEANRLGAQDVRALLRKGTASGYAEVDFLGADRGRYRARWSLRRARDRVDGTLGKQTVELKDLATGTPLGGTKTEVLTEIEERLGLSFDQFRRSALLAQGEFAAFLRAEEKDRSSLLEQMTGSEIYTSISVAAFRRAADERAKLEAIRGRLADLVVLEPLERVSPVRSRRRARSSPCSIVRVSGTRRRRGCVGSWQRPPRP
jgi:exonuclease SbcC